MNKSFTKTLLILIKPTKLNLFSNYELHLRFIPVKKVTPILLLLCLATASSILASTKTNTHSEISNLSSLEVSNLSHYDEIYKTKAYLEMVDNLDTQRVAFNDRNPNLIGDAKTQTIPIDDDLVFYIPKPIIETHNTNITDRQSEIKEEIQRKLYDMPKVEQIVEDVYVDKMPYINNYLNYDLTQPCGYTGQQLEEVLPNGLKGLGDSLIQAEKYGINAIALLAIARLESQNGTSNIARLKNNILGYGAYDSSPTSSAKSYSSYSDCLLTTAPIIVDDYLSENGKYYKGKTLAKMNIRYSSSTTWSTELSSIIRTTIYKLNNTPTSN